MKTAGSWLQQGVRDSVPVEFEIGRARQMIKDLNPDSRFEDLAAPGGNVDHVDVYYNAGHPGVEEPHIHVVLWHVPVADEARVAE